jgi:hypothetical protein
MDRSELKPRLTRCGPQPTRPHARVVTQRLPDGMQDGVGVGMAAVIAYVAALVPADYVMAWPTGS